MIYSQPSLFDRLFSVAETLIVVLIILALIACIIRTYFYLERASLDISPKPNGIVFGKIGIFRVYSPTKKEGHILVNGGTGSGKTSSILIPTLNAWSGSSFSIDISGDISSKVDMPNMLEISPLSDNSLPYNIFAPVDQTVGIEAQNEALEKLAYLLIPELPTSSNANAIFYNDNGRNILIAALIAFYHRGFDFVPICEKIIDSSWQQLFKEIDDSKNNAAIRYINGFVGSNESNTAGCKQSCDAAIKLFATNYKLKRTLRRSNDRELSFSPDLIEKYNVFFCIPDDALDVMRPLMHIVTAQVLHYFSSRPLNYTQPVLLTLDEFSSLGKLEIIEALRKYRKRHVRVMVLTQALADLDLTYGEIERKAMLNNFRFKVVLGAEDVETQQYFSDLIGKTAIKRNADHQIIADATYRVSPDKLGKLGKRLVLIHPQGHLMLYKNFYFKR